MAEWHDELVTRIRSARPCTVQHRAVLEEDSRIIATQGRAQQSNCILGIRRHGHPPADAVHPGHFVRLAMPRITALEEPARHPNDERRGEAVAGAPAQSAAVIELLGR